MLSFLENSLVQLFLAGAAIGLLGLFGLLWLNSKDSKFDKRAYAKEFEPTKEFPGNFEAQPPDELDPARVLRAYAHKTKKETKDNS